MSHFKKENPSRVVLLLGWLGCKSKYLKRYVNYYENRDFEVVEMCPSKYMFTKLNTKVYARKHAKRILRYIYQKNLNKLPVIIHCFSNGGACMYYAIAKVIEEKNMQDIEIIGSIFDSAPGRCTFLSTFRATKQVVNGNAIFKNISAFSCVAFILPFMIFMKSLSIVLPRAKIDSENYRFFLFKSLAQLPSFGPEHFIFSEKDAVLPSKGVKCFIKHRRHQGASVSEKHFSESEHVKLMFNYPEEYMDSIDWFLLSLGLKISTLL